MSEVDLAPVKVEEITYRIQKTRFTTAYNVIHPLLDQHVQQKTVVESLPEAKKLEKFLRRMEDSLEKLESYIEQNEAHEEQKKKTNPDYLDENLHRQIGSIKTLQQQFAEANALYEKITKAFFKSQQVAANKNGGAARSLQSPSKTVPKFVVEKLDDTTRISDSLKPDRLSHEADVFQYINWKRNFHAYIEINKMSLKSEKVQMGVLFGCLDDDLCKYLMVHFSTLPNVPVFPPDRDEDDDQDEDDDASYMNALEKYFDLRHPKALRVFKYLTCVQAGHETVSAYTTRMEMLAIAAEYDELTPQDLLKYKVVTGITDNIMLRDKLLMKCDRMSIIEVKKFIRDFEMTEKMSNAIEKQVASQDSANALSHYANSRKIQKQNSYTSNIGNGSFKNSLPSARGRGVYQNNGTYNNPGQRRSDANFPNSQQTSRFGSARGNGAQRGRPYNKTAPSGRFDLRCRFVFEDGRKCNFMPFYDCRKHFNKGQEKYAEMKARYGSMVGQARQLNDDDDVINLIRDNNDDGYVDHIYKTDSVRHLDVIPTNRGANYLKDRNGLPIMQLPHATPLAYVRIRQINVRPPADHMTRTPTTEILACPDTGATRTLMHISLAEECMFHDFDIHDQVNMTAANGNLIRCFGSATALIEYFGHKVRQRIYIMDDIDPAMIFLSWDVMIAFQMIPREFPLPMEHCQLDDLSRPVRNPHFNPAAEQAIYINRMEDAAKDAAIAREQLKADHPNVEPKTNFTSAADESYAIESLNKHISQYPVVFDTSFRKQIKAPKMRLRFKKGVPITPYKCTSTIPTPYALREAARREISEYLQMGIIRKVLPHEKIEWCAKAMFVAKEGTNPDDPNKSVRLVVDNRGQNVFLERSPWPFQSPKDLAKSIPPSAKYFIALDLYKGYFQIPIEDDDQLKTAFMVHELGCFAFRVCPQGNCLSGDHFNRVTDFLVEGIEGCLKLIDDVLIHGDTIDQLFQRLNIFTKRCDDNNFTLHPRKIQIGDEVNFAGFIINRGGIAIDKRKVNAVREFKRPYSVTDAKAFVGLATQFKDACPNLMGLLKPITEATSNKVTPNVDHKNRKIKNHKRIIDWTPCLEEAFEKVKKALTNTDGRVLAQYDPGRKLYIYTDAARLSGYGWVAIQKDDNGHNRLVECGSATVSDSASRNFSVTELELQAVLLAMQKMRMMTEGNTNIEVKTDHQPLVGLHNKPLDKMETKRQMKMMEKLAEFSYTISYVSGKKNEVADCLSRYPLPEQADEVMDAYPHTNFINVMTHEQRESGPLTIQKMVEAANSCEEYISIRDAIMTFDNPIDLPPDHPARKYKSDWNSLAIEQDLITFNERILVPKALRTEVLQSLHKAHMGLQKTTALANKLYFWRGMAKQIEQMIDLCEQCQVHARFQRKEPLQPSIATFPMEANSVDLAEHAKKKYLIQVDRFTGFLWVHQLANETSAETQKHLWNTFHVFGYPKFLRSDNGGQFISDSFIARCKADGIEQQFSDPYMSQSNGLAEKYVGIAKAIIKKADNIKNLQQLIMNYNQAPNSSGLSPSQLMFRRNVRTDLPTLDRNLKPIPDDEINEAIDKKQATMDKQQRHYDKTAAPLPKIDVGTVVRVFNFRTRKWDLKAEVMKLDWNTGRSYRLRTKNGSWFFRNRRFIKVCKQKDDHVLNVRNHLEGHVWHQDLSANSSS